MTQALALLFGGAVYLDVSRDGEGALRKFLLVLGALVAFSAGASQVGLAVGPLLPLLDPFALPAVFVLMVGGLGRCSARG